MRGSEKPESSPPSRRLSFPSKNVSAPCATPGATQGWRARAPSRETSVGKNEAWLNDQASVIASTPAQISGIPAFAGCQGFGTHPATIGNTGKQFSYFPSTIAIWKKIISSRRTPLTRSTDHVDNNKHPEDGARVARHLGGLRRRHLHRACHCGHLPARSLVIHVTRDHRRRTTPLAAPALHRFAARARAALCHRL